MFVPKKSMIFLFQICRRRRCRQIIQRWMMIRSSVDKWATFNCNQPLFSKFRLVLSFGDPVLFYLYLKRDQIWAGTKSGFQTTNILINSFIPWFCRSSFTVFPCLPRGEVVELSHSQCRPDQIRVVNPIQSIFFIHDCSTAEKYLAL